MIERSLFASIGLLRGQSGVFVKEILSAQCPNPLFLRPEITQAHVDVIKTAIAEGQTIALCSLREPPKNIEDWLVSIKKSLPPADGFRALLKTSGTTASPKTAVISQAAFTASAASANNYFSFGPKDCWCLNLPLYHVSGLSVIFRALLAGASIYMAATHQQLLAALAQKKISHLSLVPTQLSRLLDDRADFSGLKAVVLGGDYLPAPLKERALRCGIPLYESYGATETAAMVYVRDAKTNLGTILPHAQLRIAPDQEILVGGQSLFDGYLEARGVVKETTPDGHFPTGDLGNLDYERQLQLIGRKNARIISGGENIQAEEIEKLLETHTYIKRALVFGAPCRIYGARPVAVLDLVDQNISGFSLKNYLAPHVAGLKIPDQFFVWPKDLAKIGKKPRKQAELLWADNQASWTRLS